jgi:hypothetical protein
MVGYRAEGHGENVLLGERIKGGGDRIGVHKI